MKPALTASFAALMGALTLSTGVVRAADIRGAIVDDSSTVVAAPRGNAEFNTSLDGTHPPSSVRERDIEAMKRSVATLPKSEATQTTTLSEADTGALFESGRAELLSGTRTRLDGIADTLRGRRNLRFLVVGHADSQRLSAAARKLFRDNQGLSEARSFEVAQYLRGRLGLEAEAFTVRGAGDREPVADNATPAGMARNRRVELQVWYEREESVAAAPVVPLEHDACAADSQAADSSALRITLDGQPLNAGEPVNEADRQRCVDVATNKHDIQIQFDPLKTEPALNVTATPDGVAVGEPVTLATYSNYVHWINKAEIRFFTPGQDPREPPFLVLPVQIGSLLRWTPPADMPAESLLLLRVYDAQGRFDETHFKKLSILDRPSSAHTENDDAAETLAGYGESSLRVHNIPVEGGSVTVSGRDVTKGGRVDALGAQVPIDAQGRFVTRQLLPAGTHTVNVDLFDSAGEPIHFTRNLTIPRDTWFYVALGEFTAAANHTTGPAMLVTQDSDRYDKDTEITGRGALYAKGKVRNDYLVTLSADTRERPVEDLFSNFTSRDPRFLLERIDEERAYPVFGDDSTSEWDAPTNGRFYARVERHDSRAVWGNFQTAWTGLELNQFSRGLYGADVQVKTDAATSFGERKSTTDLFGAEPGTLNSREEFRGTGGSLYYLHRQDITRGSERLWIEVRDETSAIVLQRLQLIPGIDYELSYLQGRILLRAPLPSVVDGSTLVQLGSLSGNPAFLVASYEYSPGLNDPQSNVYGLRQSTWVNDHVRLGLSGYRQGDRTDRQSLGGLDATLRYAPSTYLDLEGGRSDGAGSQLGSIDGGFGFQQSTTADTRADAKRVQGVFDLADFSSAMRGRGNLYWQDREAGFSGAGALASGTGIEQKGGAFSVPLSTRVSADVKADDRDASTESISAQQAAVHFQMNSTWGLSVGGRHDDRDNSVPNASALLSQNGARTDAVVRLDYKPVAQTETTLPANGASMPTRAGLTAANGTTTTTLQPRANSFDVTHATVPADLAAQVAERPSAWQAYTYVQGTVDRSEDRDENNRAGVGAERQITDRFRLGGEGSGGNGGFGGRLSGDYRVDDRTSFYLAHTMETEREDSTYRGRFDNTVLGGRTKLSDQLSLYDEARNGRGAGPESLTNAFGVDYAPSARLTYGLKLEAGTVSDPLAGDLDRRAAALSAAYREQRVKLNSSVEYRNETGLNGDRETWLARNTAAYQVNPDWRVLGKANVSFSRASQGNFFDGNFVDASLGGAWRPVENDRWNTLLQYRYFYTLPSPGQVSLGDELLDYAQRSHVVSVDSTYDVLPWLALGGKVAQRTGELRNTRVGGDWSDSRTDLVILRADLHLVKEWDMLLEGRRLAVHEADDSRSGLLAAIYRHLNAHLKIGAGYNFTDFSDDLTDLSYRSRGPFVNVLSTF
jgi:outer membrane protein OmpA-like peptidoglycan-associated protein